MPVYRWQDYHCTNLGRCQSADAGQLIDLPCGAEPLCPTCGKPVIPLRARAIVPVAPPASARWPTANGPLRLVAPASVALLALALAGGAVWRLGSAPGRLHRDGPEGVTARAITVGPAQPVPLSLRVAAEVKGRVGQALEVPVAVNPADGPEPTLTVVGALPPGVRLDAASKRLVGIPRNPGLYAVALKASAPGRALGLAALSFTIAEAQPSPSPLLEARPSPASIAEGKPSPTPTETPAAPVPVGSDEALAQGPPDRSRSDPPETRASERVRPRRLAAHGTAAKRSQAATGQKPPSKLEKFFGNLGGWLRQKRR